MKGVKYSYSILLCSIVLLLAGCGGGSSGGGGISIGGPTQDEDGYVGSTSQAKIDDSSLESLSRAAISGANQSTLTIIPLPAGRASEAVAHEDLVGRLKEWLSQSRAQRLNARGAARQADNSADLCPLGGTALVEYNDPGTINDFTFTDCTYTDGVHTFVVTGQIHVERDENGHLTAMQASDLVVAIDGTERILNFTSTCANVTNCTYYSDFRGYDDRLYRLTNIAVMGSETSGYDIDATIYDPDMGYVEFSTSEALFFDCPNGYPSTGTIDLRGADGSTASVTYDCSGFIATLLGVAYTFYW